MMRDLEATDRDSIFYALGDNIPKASTPIKSYESEWAAQPSTPPIYQPRGRGIAAYQTLRPNLGRGYTLGSILRHQTPQVAPGNFPPIGAERKQYQKYSHVTTSRPSSSILGQPQLVVHSPRLPSFSGDKKSEVSYRQWRAELRGLLVDVSLPMPSIVNTIRRSLKGIAANCLLNYGEGTFNPHDLIREFDELFGEVLTSEQVLAKFFASAQEPEESVTAWACRLREVLSQCPDDTYSSGPQHLAILRQKFWSGLRSEKIKTATRHKFDAGKTLNELIVSARVVEQEIGLGKPKPVSLLSPNPTAQEVETVVELKKKIQALEKEMSELKREKQKVAAKVTDATAATDVPGFNGHCNYCKKKGHMVADCYKLKHKNSGNGERPLEMGNQGLTQ